MNKQEKLKSINEKIELVRQRLQELQKKLLTGNDNSVVLTSSAIYRDYQKSSKFNDKLKRLR